MTLFAQDSDYLKLICENTAIKQVHGELTEYVAKNITQFQNTIPSYSKQVFFNRRFARHLSEFIGIGQLSLEFEEILFTYISGLVPSFTYSEANLLANYVRAIVENQDDISHGRYHHVMIMTPAFGPFHDRLGVNIILRAINIALNGFGINIRVRACKSAKIHKEKCVRISPKCESDGFSSYERNKKTRDTIRSPEQHHANIILIAVNADVTKHTSEQNTLLNGYIVHDTKFNIIVKYDNPSHSVHLIKSGFGCNNPQMIELVGYQSFPLTYDMCETSIQYASIGNTKIDNQSKNLSLRSTIPISNEIRW